MENSTKQMKQQKNNTILAAIIFYVGRASKLQTLFARLVCSDQGLALEITAWITFTRKAENIRNQPLLIDYTIQPTHQLQRRSKI